MSQHWHDLQVAALLGSQKTTVIKHWPNEGVANIAQNLPDDSNSLLAPLALMSVYQRAGQQPTTLPSHPAADVETGRYPSATMLKHLHYLLSHDGQDYLLDWLLLASQHHLLCPRAMLPQLLKLGENNKKWRLGIAQIAGKRGYWLAQQNPEWAWLIGGQYDLDQPQFNDYWQNAALASRELLFERWRRAEPTRALAFLQQIWPEENANNRKVFVEKLAINLSDDDHDFLEQCLDDRSKVVKEAVLQLLLRLPQSLLVQRLQQACMTILTIKKGLVSKNLEVTPLLTITAALERDGLEAKPKKIDSLGEKAQWLRDIIAGVSLEWLLSYCEMDAATLLAKILKTEWATALCTGLIVAATRQQHQGWLKALLAVDDLKMPVTHGELLAELAIAEREKILLQQLLGVQKTALPLKSVVSLLKTLPSWAWSRDFTLKILESYQHFQGHNQKLSYEFEYQVLPQLQTLIARCGDASLGQQPNQYPPQILSTWQFRVEMRQAFANI